MITGFKDKIPKISENVFIADSAEVIGDIEIGISSSIWFGAIIRGDRSEIKIGSRTNVQDNAVIHSDPDSAVEVGDDVTIGHGAILHGCKVNDNVIIGMNATVLDGAEIGKNSIVGAGALVPPGKKFPEKSIIIGVPAIVKKEASEVDIEKIKNAAETYLKLSAEYVREKRK